jgi:hypothetical protein
MRAAGLTPVKTSNYLYLPERLFAVVGRLEKWLAAVPAGGQFAVFGMRDSQAPPSKLDRAPAAGL